MKIALIVAMSQNRVIGKNNQLIWHLPKDLQFFKKITQGHHIIMGRKTFESIGKPLPKRTNIVISRQNLQIPDCKVVTNLEKAFQIAKQSNETTAFVVGGQQIYELAIPFAHQIYLTHIHTKAEGDTFFPELDNSWKAVWEEKHYADEKHAFDFDFVLYEKI